MNIYEANLLDRGFSSLNDTLLRKRMMEQQAAEHAGNLALGRDELAQRMADRADMAANRKLALESQTEHQKRLEDYQKQLAAAKDEATKWQIFENLGKEGLLTQEAVDRMSDEFNTKFAPAGVGVRMFKLPPPKPGFDTREGHNLRLAETYRQRADEALRNGGGDLAERWNAIADRLERGGTPEPEATADVTEELGTVDPLTGKGEAQIRRRLRGADLDAAMRRYGGGRTGTPSILPTANAGQQQFETVGQAHEAGKKAGDIIMLYDPQQKKYRKFQLE